ncbi:hypothetical protein BDZ45DRAFT_591161, partial [Acephala macrosclerotiorum]
HDCCINSCIAFTSEHANLIYCLHKKCKQHRFFEKTKKSQLKPRKQFFYIPLILRLKQRFDSQ